MQNDQHPGGIVRVVGAVVDQQKLTLYLVDGTTRFIPQGDSRLKPIVDKVIPALKGNNGAVVEVSLDDTHMTDNPYKDYQAKSKGITRFFRIAKDKLKQLLGHTISVEVSVAVEPPQKVGITMREPPAPPEPDQAQRLVAEKAAEEKLVSAVNEIIATAEPATSKSFTDRGTEEQGPMTIVAVVQEPSGSKGLVTGVEALRPQLKRAAELGSTLGVQTFLSRVSAVAKTRQHSVDELMHFLRRADLPIADDGSVIIYKVLKRHPSQPGTYVDCHTGKVPQKVGSFVCMDEELVDPSRRTECSSGLHVARRAYIGGFWGDVCVLAKVAPEDVVAVPLGEPNKMRVRGYHILFELDADAYACLKANKPFADNQKAKQQLGWAIAGKHVGKLEEVRIGGPMGTNVTVTPLRAKPALAVVESARIVSQPIPAPAPAPAPVAASQQPQEPVQEPVQKPSGKAPLAEPLPIPSDPSKPAPAVDPVAVAAAVQQAKAETRAGRAQRLWELFQKAQGAERRTLARELLEHKALVKLGWKALGLPADAGERLNNAVQ